MHCIFVFACCIKMLFMGEVGVFFVSFHLFFFFSNFVDYGELSLCSFRNGSFLGETVEFSKAVCLVIVVRAVAGQLEGFAFM